MTTDDIHRLINDLGSVRGWLAAEDIFMFFAVHALLSQCGVKGDLLEVGVYEGKSAIVLDRLRQPLERLVLIDPFSKVASDGTVRQEQERFYATLQRSTFERNFGTFSDGTPVVIEDFSTSLRSSDIGRPRSMRLAHIDGAHDYKTVYHDCQLVLDLLADGGIAAFDDAINPGAPGVVAAVWEHASAGGLVPLATTTKVWMCRREVHAELRTSLAEVLQVQNTLKYDEVELKYGNCLRVSPVTIPQDTPRRKVVRQLRERVLKW